MVGSQLQVHLYRDSFNTPWGFRLQGGKDLGQPLSIQRVFSNSPAEGELQRGDLIVAIGGREANELTHKQAQDLIKFGGGQITLVINRPPPGIVQSTVTIKPQRPRAPSLQLSPISPTMYGGRSHHNPCYNPVFSPKILTPTHEPPPWATQNFAPKKVSKLSKLGGGGLDFGVDYGAHTLPRRRHSTQVTSSMSGLNREPPRVVNLSRLGGGGYDFGTDYCTLPRQSRRTSSQPAAPLHINMPAAGGGHGFHPKKVTLTNLGGGGPEFGSDYSSYRPHFSQPTSFGSPSSPSQYIPTGVRLDMEREQEDRQRQWQQQQQQYQQQQQQYQQPQQQYQQPQQQYQQPQPQYQQPQPQQQYHTQYSSQPSYTPTGVLLDQQQSRGPLGPKKGTPKVLKPVPGPSPFNFGVDYSKPQSRTSSVTWRPQPAHRPVNVPPPPEPVQTASTSWKQQEAAAPGQGPPAWRESLKPSTGVKPWDSDLDYVGGQQQGPRSAPFQPAAAAAPFTPPQNVGSQADGPKVVHLQYNSPMGLYSKQNVEETYAGQARALAAGAASPGSVQVQNPAKPGDRDWTQSAVYRMIYEDEHRGGPRSQPPPTAPKPPSAPGYSKPAQIYTQQSFTGLEDEVGTSDF